MRRSVDEQESMTTLYREFRQQSEIGGLATGDLLDLGFRKFEKTPQVPMIGLEDVQHELCSHGMPLGPVAVFETMPDGPRAALIQVKLSRA